MNYVDMSTQYVGDDQIWLSLVQDWAMFAYFLTCWAGVYTGSIKTGKPVHVLAC